MISFNVDAPETALVIAMFGKQELLPSRRWRVLAANVATCLAPLRPRQTAGRRKVAEVRATLSQHRLWELQVSQSKHAHGPSSNGRVESEWRADKHSTPSIPTCIDATHHSQPKAPLTRVDRLHAVTHATSQRALLGR